MRNRFFQVVLLSAFLASASAFAVPFSERLPIRQARMEIQLGDGLDAAPARATLAMFGRRARVRGMGLEPTLLILSEATGIRCVQAPCPSSRDQMFQITGTETRDGAKIYSAVERVPVTDSTSKAETSRLVLTEYTESPSVRVRYRWFATLYQSKGVKKSLFGNPTSLDMLDAKADANSALDVHIPGWERPLEKARLLELENGREVNPGYTKHLVLNRRDNAGRATSFWFIEERKEPCSAGGACPVVEKRSLFRVLDAKKDVCGVVSYVARETKNDGNRTITVFDRTRARCASSPDHGWEARLREEDQQVRFFAGNPEPVVTIR